VANLTLNIWGGGLQLGGLKTHTHNNQTLNSTKGTLKSISYCLSLHITEHFKNYCGIGNKLTLNNSGRGSKLPLNQISYCEKRKKTIKN
jgi:hypothetical protein